MGESADRVPTWLEQMETRGRSAPVPGDAAAPAVPAPAVPADAAPGEPSSAVVHSENGRPTAPARELDPSEAMIESLRDEAVSAARDDAAAGVPDAEVNGRSESERVLTERCRAYFDRWRSDERHRREDRIGRQEHEITDQLGRASLGLDRLERLTNELVRLKARISIRRGEVANELEERKNGRKRGLPTRVYLIALGFLGLVEFFANAPVFSALLPRDPLTERQIRLVAETSEGWLAGAQRVIAHLILRPDAALLAAGVVTFLCVLAHFFGHSLRELVMQGDRRARGDTVSTRSPMENIVPMILAGLGLMLVLGVLYEARITLGEVGEEQYVQDIEVVTELRRNASWLRVDGDLLAANEQENRAEDMEAAASELREYAGSMSRLSFPILLLNLTLVLCAISAAYFHRRDGRREQFNEGPFEMERRDFIRAAEEVAQEVATSLAELTRRIRGLETQVQQSSTAEARSLGHQLESIVSLYRAENGRARGIDPRSLPAFSDPVDLTLDEVTEEGTSSLRPPQEYEVERERLRIRFDEVRGRFNAEAIAQ